MSLKKTFTVFPKRVLLLFFDFGVYPIAEIFPFFLQLFEVIANPGGTFKQSCAGQYEVFFALSPHEITKVVNDFPYYW